jgi:hypothetical protein
MRRILVILSLMALGLVAPTEAAEPKEIHTFLVIHQCTGKVVAEPRLGRRPARKDLGDDQTWVVQPGEAVSIRLEDPNPLLFSYSWKEGPKTDSANAKVIADLVASFKQLSDQLQAITKTGGGARTAQGQPSPASESDRALEVLKQLGTDLNDLATDLEKVPDLIKDSGKGCEAAAEVKKKVAAWQAPALLEKLDGDLKEIDKWALIFLREDLASNPPPSKPPKDQQQAQESPPKVPSPLALNITRAQALGPQVREMMAALKSFDDAARGIQVPIIFSPPIQFDAAHDSHGTFEIALASGNETVAKGAKVEGKPGKYPFTLLPYSPVDLAVGPAMIYSFIETQEYGTKTENGKILIVRKDSGNQVNGLTVGAMLSITPRAWSNPAFRGSIQLGASPVKDKIGLFLGGGIKFFNLLSIGGGIAYQQAQRLAPGLALNQEIASEDKLKTNIVFKSGFYLTITLDFGGKK